MELFIYLEIYIYILVQMLVQWMAKEAMTDFWLQQE